MTTTTKYALRDIRQRDAQPIMCEKVIINGFDYYVSDEKFSFNEKVFNTQENTIETWLLPHTTTSPCFKKVIATNNPDIELLKVVDEVEELESLAKQAAERKIPLQIFPYAHVERRWFFEGHIDGYNQAQQKHRFSEEDMIDFSEFAITYWEEMKFSDFLHFKPKTKQELIQLWKDQQPITIYYDSGSNNSDNA